MAIDDIFPINMEERDNHDGLFQGNAVLFFTSGDCQTCGRLMNALIFPTFIILF